MAWGDQDPPELAFRSIVGTATSLGRGLDADVVARPVVLHLDHICLPPGAMRLGENPIAPPVDFKLSRQNQLRPLSILLQFGHLRQRAGAAVGRGFSSALADLHCLFSMISTVSLASPPRAQRQVDTGILFAIGWAPQSAKERGRGDVELAQVLSVRPSRIRRLV